MGYQIIGYDIVYQIIGLGNHFYFNIRIIVKKFLITFVTHIFQLVSIDFVRSLVGSGSVYASLAPSQSQYYIWPFAGIFNTIFSSSHVCTVRQFQIVCALVCLLFCLFLSQTFCILFSAQFFFSMPVINFMEMHQWCLFVCANSGITYARKHEADGRRALHVMLNILP